MKRRFQGILAYELKIVITKIIQKVYTKENSPHLAVSLWLFARTPDIAEKILFLTDIINPFYNHVTKTALEKELKLLRNGSLSKLTNSL